MARRGQRMHVHIVLVDSSNTKSGSSVKNTNDIVSKVREWDMQYAGSSRTEAAGT